MSFVSITRPTIFHSGVAADFYKYYMLRNGTRAIRSSYFHSWDIYKQCENPQSLHGRYLFCRQFLHLQDSFTLTDTPFYDLPASAQLEPLVHSLPRLAYIYEQSKKHNIPKKLAESIELLYKQYAQFLKYFGRQESTWTVPEIEPGMCLFLPELFNQGEHAANITQCSTIHCGDLPKPESISYTQFPDLGSECDHCMASIETLLDTGTDAEDIVITLASPEDYRSSLEARAHYYEVPISIHVGTALSDYPGSRLFLHMENCRANRFSVESLQELFMDPSLQWKSSEQLHKIISTGKQFGISKGILEIDPERWKTCLHEYMPRLGGMYNSLRYALITIYRSKSFADLRKHIYYLINNWFYDTQIEQHNLGLALKELDTLVELENELQGLDAEGKQASIIQQRYIKPWEHFITWLRKYLYTPHYNTSGIAVYPYGVSAGIRPQHHFILGCSLSATQRVDNPAPWINEPTQGRMHIDTLDQTEAFIQAYCRSGEHVIFSFATNCFEKQYTPQHYVEADVQEASTISASTHAAKQERRSAELAWYNVYKPIHPAGPEPRHPHLNTFSQLQHRALTHQLATGLRSNVQDYRSSCIEDKDLRNQLAERVGNFSPHSIDQFLSCPFTFLMQNILELYKDDEQESLLHKVMGMVYHDVLAKVFSEHAGAALALPPSEHLSAIIEKSIARHKLPAYAIDLAVQREKILYTVSTCIQSLAKHFPDWQIFATEKKYELAYNNARIVGKIDLILIHEGRLSIIDYKKSAVFTRKDLYGEGRKTIQLPLYAYLLQECEGQHGEGAVESAHYYSLEKGALKTAYAPMKPHMLYRREFQELVAAIPSIVSDIQERVEQGDYRCPDGCEHCRMPELSRSRYQVGL